MRRAIQASCPIAASTGLKARDADRRERRGRLLARAGEILLAVAPPMALADARLNRRAIGQQRDQCRDRVRGAIAEIAQPAGRRARADGVGASESRRDRACLAASASCPPMELHDA